MLNSQQREELLDLSTALLVDARDRLGLPESHLDPGIRPVVPFSRMAGTAVTVRLELPADPASADLSLLSKSYESPPPDTHSIIVIQVPQELHGHGIVGEGACTVARIFGFVGALIEGAARDSHELRDLEFPVFSRTISPGYIVGKVSAIAANEPVFVGGRTIQSGDVVVGDNDGVVVIRQEELGDVIAKAKAIKEWEHQVHTAITAGRDFEKALAEAGPMP